MLIAFAGRSGTGKSTLARALARELGAVYLRIDTIEEAIIASTGRDVGAAGYRVGYAVAEDNLRLGRIVVADCVNPLGITRDAWRAAAERTGLPCVEVEVVCSDAAEHRRRVETRDADDSGIRRLTWPEVSARDIEPWTREHVVIDTARRTTEECLRDLVNALSAGYTVARG
jgi:predicted kinase